jgi:hypothetical protein
MSKDYLARIQITVIFKKNDGTTYVPRKTEKRFLARSACLNNLKSAYLRVRYLPGVENSGDFYTKKDFLQALNAWTEPEQLEYVYGSEW